MKKYWIPIVIVFALVLAALGYAAFNLDKTQDALQIANLRLAVQNDTITSIRTKSGDLVAKIQSVEVDRDNLKDALEEMGLDRKKLRDQKIKLQDVISVLQVKLEAEGHGETTIRDTIRIEKSDTVRIGQFKWSNKYLFLDGSIKDKQMDFDYLYQTRISNIQDQNRKGTTVSLTLSDPKAKIIDGASFTVIHKKSLLEKWWIVGPIGILAGILISK